MFDFIKYSLPHTEALYSLGLRITAGGICVAVVLVLILYILRRRLSKKLDRLYGEVGRKIK